jgi:hypothetical protein
MVKTKRPAMAKELFFKKPNESHRFVFCGCCGVVQRSDNIPSHFKSWHIAGSENTLKKGQLPQFPFTKRWENYVKKCFTDKRTISRSQWKTISFRNQNK